jgi:hypothetical protein
MPLKDEEKKAWRKRLSEVQKGRYKRGISVGGWRKTYYRFRRYRPTDAEYNMLLKVQRSVEDITATHRVMEYLR